MSKNGKRVRMTNFVITVRFFLIHIIIVFFTTSKYVRYGITVAYYVSIESAMCCGGEEGGKRKKKTQTDGKEVFPACWLLLTSSTY